MLWLQELISDQYIWPDCWFPFVKSSRGTQQSLEAVTLRFPPSEQMCLPHPTQCSGLFSRRRVSTLRRSSGTGTLSHHLGSFSLSTSRWHLDTPTPRILPSLYHPAQHLDIRRYFGHRTRKNPLSGQMYITNSKTKKTHFCQKL